MNTTKRLAAACGVLAALALGVVTIDQAAAQGKGGGGKGGGSKGGMSGGSKGGGPSAGGGGFSRGGPAGG
ncbi:MAG: hypothetical protein ACREUW_01565, partial [Burkholderiales bacterium]